jgi:ElaB/YqjD/DUF883 family membrane-anchored ribosome-binding protein
MSAKKEKQSSAPGQPAEESIGGSQGGGGWGQSADDGAAGPLDEGTENPESTTRRTISDAVGDTAETVASSTASAGDALKDVGRAATEGAAEAASHTYTAGTEAAHIVERQTSESPWTTFLAGTLVGCLLGFVLASRR